MYNLSIDEISMVDGGGDGSGYPASNGSYSQPSKGYFSSNCIGNVIAGAVMGASGGVGWAAMGAAAGAYTGQCFNGKGGY
ncbi:TPA: hypothetical protein ACYHOF_000194 [Vibrio cholerae]|nr:hypothetical protein [Vibrio cholerae]EKF9876530.1 hypothetical protein [Vibrio cholerae]ELF1352020.1 hypothetical protein [Vibrio cholerae]ELJ8474215.1 hypothetical protein [Vibrio cholerae]ELJ8617058.1 hypothetical protein [Vibrio cholerae]